MYKKDLTQSKTRLVLKTQQTGTESELGARAVPLKPAPATRGWLVAKKKTVECGPASKAREKDGWVPLRKEHISHQRVQSVFATPVKRASHAKTIQRSPTIRICEAADAHEVEIDGGENVGPDDDRGHTPTRTKRQRFDHALHERSANIRSSLIAQTMKKLRTSPRRQARVEELAPGDKEDQEQRTQCRDDRTNTSMGMPSGRTNDPEPKSHARGPHSIERPTRGRETNAHDAIRCSNDVRVRLWDVLEMSAAEQDEEIEFEASAFPMTQSTVVYRRQGAELMWMEASSSSRAPTTSTRGEDRHKQSEDNLSSRRRFSSPLAYSTEEPAESHAPAQHSLQSPVESNSQRQTLTQCPRALNALNVLRRAHNPSVHRRLLQRAHQHLSSTSMLLDKDDDYGEEDQEVLSWYEQVEAQQYQNKLQLS
ncbi:hypothetical protein FVE85_9118 [Porphyridium purpureum]|uniref:Uncharacterized protein n=1 Tax=Porphyridium purpureum TaxID=35688 RepID=A0A5J4YNF9_PORPP|nr:hypothetical protein FVE85_9118 [Porphyridium purpureum]|eukprot:POR5327..scf222_8